jgi:ATP-dependent Clp protease ATP-binding subunit ClpA
VVDQIAAIDSKVETCVEAQDYYGAANFKKEQELLKAKLQTIRLGQSIPRHLRPHVKASDIGTVLAEKMGLPTSLVNESDLAKLKRLETDMKTDIQ